MSTDIACCWTYFETYVWFEWSLLREYGWLCFSTNISSSIRGRKVWTGVSGAAARTCGDSGGSASARPWAISWAAPARRSYAKRTGTRTRRGRHPDAETDICSGKQDTTFYQYTTVTSTCTHHMYQSMKSFNMHLI